MHENLILASVWFVVLWYCYCIYFLVHLLPSHHQALVHLVDPLHPEETLRLTSQVNGHSLRHLCFD